MSHGEGEKEHLLFNEGSLACKPEFIKGIDVRAKRFFPGRVQAAGLKEKILEVKNDQQNIGTPFCESRRSISREKFEIQRKDQRIGYGKFERKLRVSGG